MVIKTKKYVCILMIAVICFTLTACGKAETGSYYPDNTEMQTNLEKAGYSVNQTNISEENYTGTCLSASKANDYIEFYWLDNEEAIDTVSKELKEKHDDYEQLVRMENDSKFGTFIFCATDSAADDAGIKIVDVTVDID